VVGHRFAIGVADATTLWGVAIVGRPVARMLDQNSTTAEVLRTCVKEGAPKGCNSKLYAASWRVWREMGGTRLVTYTLASESGASLRGAGWKVVAEVTVRTKPWHGPDRAREYQPVYGQKKFRWETAVSGDLVLCPAGAGDDVVEREL
jgi:hypothetical protein